VLRGSHYEVYFESNGVYNYNVRTNTGDNTMKKLLASINYDYGFSIVCEGETPGARTWFRCAYVNLYQMTIAQLCRFKGHDYRPDGRDYIESGGEGFSCTRCGANFMAWH
jgi:hypothetical protein